MYCVLCVVCNGYAGKFLVLITSTRPQNFCVLYEFVLLANLSDEIVLDVLHSVFLEKSPKLCYMYFDASHEHTHGGSHLPPKARRPQFLRIFEEMYSSF